MIHFLLIDESLQHLCTLVEKPTCAFLLLVFSTKCTWCLKTSLPWSMLNLKSTASARTDSSHLTGRVTWHICVYLKCSTYIFIQVCLIKPCWPSFPLSLVPPVSHRASKPRQTRWFWRRARAPPCRSPSWPPLLLPLLCRSTRAMSRCGWEEADLLTEQITAITSGWTQCRYRRCTDLVRHIIKPFHFYLLSCKGMFTPVVLRYFTVFSLVHVVSVGK